MANMNKQYANTIPVMTIESYEKSLVFVVDMLHGFISEGALSDPTIHNIVGPIQKLLDIEKEHIFICDEHAQDSIEFEAFPPHCIKGSKEASIVDELLPYASDIIHKNSTNAFMSAGVQNRIREWMNEFDTFVIVGCCTDICILQFALSLKMYINENNYKEKQVVVPVNMVETYHIDGIHDQVARNEIAFDLMKESNIKIIKGSIDGNI